MTQGELSIIATDLGPWGVLFLWVMRELAVPRIQKWRWGNGKDRRQGPDIQKLVEDIHKKLDVHILEEERRLSVMEGSLEKIMIHIDYLKIKSDRQGGAL